MVFQSLSRYVALWEGGAEGEDHIDVKGHDSPSGFLALVGKMMATEDAHMVSIMRSAGAVFYTSASID